MAYRRADFAVLRDTGYGIGVHWTTATVPSEGDRLPFPQAVERFDVEAFVEQVASTGAGHVLVTSTHSRHWFAGPNAETDRILPGRTCERDLLMELADGLGAAGIRLCLYYNSGIHAGDPDWKEAVGADAADPSGFFDNWRRVVGWMGEHYGPKVIALWVDGAYEFAALGGAPWEAMTAAARSGNPERLVCYNPGIEQHRLYTPYQDYWAGEITRLNYTPRGALTPAGLPWYAFVSWHASPQKPMCGEWVMNEENRALAWRRPARGSAADFLNGFRAVGGTVAFNLFIYQDGTIYPPDLETVRELR